MFVPYNCCQKSFEDYYIHQSGSGLGYYQGTPLQKGYGFGGLFRSLFRAAVPLFKSGAKAVGKQLFHSGVDVLNDISKGDNFKVATQRRLKEAGRNLTEKASNKVKTMIGSGRRNKKRKQSKNNIIRRKSKKTWALNERVVSSSSNTYPYHAYVETLLSYGEDAKKSLLTCECFYKDTFLDVSDPLQKENGNEGLKKLYDLTFKNQILDMIGPLHCDTFQQNHRLLLNLVDVKIKMTRTKPDFCLMSTKTGEPYKVVLQYASLFIRKVKVSPCVSLGHAKALEKSTAKYPIDRVLCKTYSIPKGSVCWSFIQDYVFLGVMPKRVVVGCIDKAAINGQLNLNPFLFDHCNVNFLSIYVDEQPVPTKPLELNYETNCYIRAYNQMFSGLNRDSGNYLTREEFAQGHTLYVLILAQIYVMDRILIYNIKAIYE
ncbi:uncharacterized protein F54H12.2 [Trichonephila inaurata madagascariensis]|uniref:Uncharacterized protein F54H12.2 n=1 Tax=Trichonephila inaurata madagascariensis TaxID=2747483 RepID=A0A8X6M5B1_9ARAC|nr:uncharacterized protein F54H12.2 [Trichonephila inaurata madagascariensis]